MRLFIAIDLPEEWKSALAQVESSIGWLGRGVKWVNPHSVHLTLRFLGEASDSLLPEIENSLKAACRESEPFSMRLKGTGVFPKAKRPRVYWVGIEAPDALMQLQARIEAEMQRIGFEAEDHEFTPHLTLARIKDPIGKERITGALLDYRLESPPMPVREVRLMRSHLSGEGARYETLRTYLIGAPTAV
jgi:2'-5' RNA ligase